MFTFIKRIYRLIHIYLYESSFRKFTKPHKFEYIWDSVSDDLAYTLMIYRLREDKLRQRESIRMLKSINAERDIDGYEYIRSEYGPDGIISHDYFRSLDSEDPYDVYIQFKDMIHTLLSNTRLEYYYDNIQLILGDDVLINMYRIDEITGERKSIEDIDKNIQDD